jgi:hypothetical protein
MQNKSRCTWRRSRAMLLLFILGVGSVAISRIASAAWTGYGPTPQQDVIRLENRINQIEQRLYSMETSLRSLEQQSRLATVNSGRVNPQDFAAFYAQLQGLQQRVLEYGCAMAKLDERTLTPAARATRRRSTTANEACRANFETPLRLPEER